MPGFKMVHLLFVFDAEDLSGLLLLKISCNAKTIETIQLLFGWIMLYYPFVHKLIIIPQRIYDEHII